MLAKTDALGQSEYLSGYLIIPTSGTVDRRFNAGYSMYVSAWSLLGHYPGHRFQTGLPGTWMFAQYEGSAPKDLYSDVEGGLGWWTDTRFPTETPKFIMGGVGPNFTEIANGPGHGAGTWEDPKGVYGVAQLSPWLLFPLDGLNLQKGTWGQWFGYGYLSLPLCEAKSKTDGKDVTTGNQCWTLFLNTRNFKGPVAFFTPYFWSQSALKDSRLVGQLLDTRPMDPNRQIQMETQYIPCRIATDRTGQTYARIAPTSFPRGSDGRTVLVQGDTAYSKQALWDSMQAWFAGGSPTTGSVHPEGAHVRTFGQGGYSTWEIRVPKPDGTESKAPLDWEKFATSTTFDPQSYGYRWKYGAEGPKNGARWVTIPEYFKLERVNGKEKQKWTPIEASQVPAETNLQKLKWDRPFEEPQQAYTTPDDLKSPWKKPGPKAGPFKAHLGDGTIVTYYWYRFADQPALQNADLTPEEREEMQAKVEKIHKAWPRDHNYLPPPRSGQLAGIDPALIVRPPKGLEIGYVPIATKQELESKSKAREKA